MEHEFSREVSGDVINALKASQLWQQKLEMDCKSGEVFLAFRHKYVSFYYKGSGLFEFDGQKFTTHSKYAAIIEGILKRPRGDVEDEDIFIEKDYVSEKDLKNARFATDFLGNYEEIKKLCEHYTQDEAEGVSNLYRYASYLDPMPEVGLLDTEIAFSAANGVGRKHDRIDILLYDARTLRFVEAKLFKNEELWNGSITEQIQRYEKQIHDRKNSIIAQYCLYIEALGKVLNSPIAIPHPKYIDDKVSLLILGFDEDQKSGRLADLRKGLEDNGISIYARGDAKGLNAKTIWENTK
jgi:hypothetical protein